MIMVSTIMQLLWIIVCFHIFIVAIEVYDSIIHQRIVRSSFTTTFWMFFGQKLEFEPPPNKANEISVTLNCHLEEELKILKESRMQFEEDVNFAFKIVSGVIQSFVLAKVVKSNSISEGVMYYQEDYSEVHLLLIQNLLLVC